MIIISFIYTMCDHLTRDSCSEVECGRGKGVVSRMCYLSCPIMYQIKACNSWNNSWLRKKNANWNLKRLWKFKRSLLEWKSKVHTFMFDTNWFWIYVIVVLNRWFYMSRFSSLAKNPCMFLLKIVQVLVQNLHWDRILKGQVDKVKGALWLANACNKLPGEKGFLE